ncbi:MAG TPA: metallophosphoesterase [Candidatus Limnocylindria bacterium]|nr:metallophosphoesterase [Candidatus Limnocylindria bacterium]
MIRRLHLPGPDRLAEDVRILAVSDETDRALDVDANRSSLGRVDGIVGAGDLEPDYLAFLADAFHAPLIYVRGNHDRGANWDARRAHLPRPLGRDGDAIRGLSVVGLSWPGQKSGQAIRDERAAWRQSLGLWLRLRGARPDIVLSHVPPRGVGDVPEDDYHRGFGAYRWLCRRLAPRLWIHGHMALSMVPAWRQEWGGTTFVNVTGAVLIEFSASIAPEERA